MSASPKLDQGTHPRTIMSTFKSTLIVIILQLLDILQTKEWGKVFACLVGPSSYRSTCTHQLAEARNLKPRTGCACLACGMRIKAAKRRVRATTPATLAMLVDCSIQVQHATVARQVTKDSFWSAVHGPFCQRSISFDDVAGLTHVSRSRRPSSAKHLASHETKLE